MKNIKAISWSNLQNPPEEIVRPVVKNKTFTAKAVWQICSLGHVQ